jgi:plasmid stabilization system protein ParE
MKTAILPAAERELQEAVAYYDSQSTTAANAFLDAYRHGVEQILRFPDAWPRGSDETRKYRLDPFPYHIIYAHDADAGEATLLAIAHTARRPEYWRNRLA